MVLLAEAFGSIAEQNKKYYEANREKILERRKQQRTALEGGVVLVFVLVLVCWCWCVGVGLHVFVFMCCCWCSCVCGVLCLILLLLCCRYGVVLVIVLCSLLLVLGHNNTISEVLPLSSEVTLSLTPQTLDLQP